MRIYKLFLLIFSFSFLSAQVIVGDEFTKVNDLDIDKIALSFDTSNMGIILPIIKPVAETNDIIKPGAIFVSAKDNRVKIYNKSYESSLLWLTNSISGSLPVDTSIENNNVNDFIIGNQTNLTKGILVLETDNKTLVLPKIGDKDNPPHKYIKDPYIGTIGFADTKNYTNPNSVLRKFMWVYGGSGNGINDNEWHLWRAGVDIPVLSVNINQAYLDNLPNVVINPTIDLIPPVSED